MTIENQNTADAPATELQPGAERPAGGPAGENLSQLFMDAYNQLAKLLVTRDDAWRQEQVARDDAWRKEQAARDARQAAKEDAWRQEQAARDDAWRKEQAARDDVWRKEQAARDARLIAAIERMPPAIPYASARQLGSGAGEVSLASGHLAVACASDAFR
ncbi:hypothetical protein IWW55_001033 [Coemansia sp. RSA 2706]|nr:hypothetical protein IWW55_001033 [Coemansia sp. RSA 2706]